MQTFKEFIIIGVTVGIVLAILVNADAAAKVIDAVSKAYFGLIQTVANVKPEK